MKTVVAGALGECVHMAGVMRFLRLAEAAGWRTVFLGPAVPVERMLQAARREEADLVGVCYRLIPETGERLLAEFAEEADDLRTAGVHFAFGGTPPVAERVRMIGFSERVFDGGEPPEAVLAYLRGQARAEPTEADYPQNTVGRIEWKAPFPILRHHFGLPTVKATREGIARIADAQVLDVVSLGIDPFIDPAALAGAVKAGVLDAPHLRGNPYARGQIATSIDGRGACVAIDSATGRPLSEEARFARLGIPIERQSALPSITGRLHIRRGQANTHSQERETK